MDLIRHYAAIHHYNAGVIMCQVMLSKLEECKEKSPDNPSRQVALLIDFYFEKLANVNDNSNRAIILDWICYLNKNYKDIDKKLVFHTFGAIALQIKLCSNSLLSYVTQTNPSNYMFMFEDDFRNEFHNLYDATIYKIENDLKLNEKGISAEKRVIKKDVDLYDKIYEALKNTSNADQCA